MVNVINHTEFDPVTMRNFATFQVRGRNTTRGLFGKLTVILTLVALLLCVLASLSEPSFFVYGVCVLLLFFGWTLLRVFLRKRLEKVYAVRNISGAHYAFGDDGFTVEVVSESIEIKESMSYSFMTSVVECEGAFYLMMGRRGTYIVSKRGFENENDLCDLRIKFSALMGKKYTILPS